VAVIIDGSLKPIQYFNLFKALNNATIIDRVQLILEIFDKHAGSREAKLQIELARLKHIIPIIKEWIRQRKIGELPGFLGAGRYKVESYYSLIKRRITHIEREIKRIREQRNKLRKSREEIGLITVAIVGYTSAGKTTLFNALTGENKKTGRELFTTLSPKIKSAHINGMKVLVLDTVGFIDYVPIEIIEAFYSTLEEILEAKVLILIVDIAEEYREIIRKINGVLETFEKIGVSGKPLIIVANKIDLINNFEEAERRTKIIYDKIAKSYDGPIITVYASALKQTGIIEVKKAIEKFIKPKTVLICMTLSEDKLRKIKTPFMLLEKKNGLYLCELVTRNYELKNILYELKNLGAKILKVKEIES